MLLLALTVSCRPDAPRTTITQALGDSQRNVVERSPSPANRDRRRDVDPNQVPTSGERRWGVEQRDSDQAVVEVTVPG